jgi:hypothetical protein
MASVVHMLVLATMGISAIAAVWMTRHVRMRTLNDRRLPNCTITNSSGTCGYMYAAVRKKEIPDALEGYSIWKYEILQKWESHSPTCYDRCTQRSRPAIIV